MIKFFRHIRLRLRTQASSDDVRKSLLMDPPDRSSSVRAGNKTSKPTRTTQSGRYFKYAIGEIVLVVIGILIALQINNWNEGRKAVIHEKSILSNLAEDLRADSASFAQNSRDLNVIVVLHDELYDVISNRTTGDSLKNATKIRTLIWYNPITKENDPFIANKISDEPIRREIQTYYRAMKDMDHIYEEFSEVIKGQMRPYLGAQGLYKLGAEFGDSENPSDWLNKEGLLDASRSVEFQQILFETHLKLAEVIEKLGILRQQNEILKERIDVILNSEQG